MAPSRRPLVEHEGRAWLGNPLAPGFSIEVADDAMVLTAPSGTTRVPWAAIASMQVDIPVASWTAARLSERLLAMVDFLNTAGSGGVPVSNQLRYGNRSIEVRLTTVDGEQVTGWAHKHQPLGYPAGEVAAALAVLRGRVN